MKSLKLPKALKLTPNQLVALHGAADEVGGVIGGDRGVKKSLVARGLAVWDPEGQGTAAITDAGLDIITGKTSFELIKLQGTTEDNGCSAQAIEISSQILKQARNKRRSS